jgi:signal transduction histidine kinase
MSASLEPERLAVLVHEVRSPVAALSAIAETVRDPDLDPRGRRELAGLAVAACRGIERIVADASLSSIRPEPVDLGELVRAACAAAALGGARIRVVVPSAALVVSCDPLRVRQALDNLISNGVTHGGGDLVVTLAGDAEAVVQVADVGPGIAPADHERIFTAGERIQEARPGSGLGLAVARAIAEGHGGSLTVRSAPGEGAVFALALPLPAAAGG